MGPGFNNMVEAGMGANQFTQVIWLPFWGDWSTCSHQGKAECTMFLAVPYSREFSTAGRLWRGTHNSEV